MAEQLQAQLDKIRQADPFRTLDVPVHVDTEGVRRAYLTLTKKFHPNRFALEPAPVREVANEVFLLIRRAYDVLADDDKRKQWRERLAPPARPITAPPAGAPASASVPRVPTVSPRPPTSVASPPPAASTIGRAMGTPPLVATARPPQAAVAPARTATVPGVAPPGAPNRRPISSPSTGLGARPEEVQAMLEAARTRGQRFEEAVGLLARGRYRDAREALYKIAMEDPQSKRYRVQLHYAWGLEHLADGKLPEGQRELERALGLEPDSADIKAALARAQEQQKKPSGILGKIFGR